MQFKLFRASGYIYRYRPLGTVWRMLLLSLSFSAIIPVQIVMLAVPAQSAFAAVAAPAAGGDITSLITANGGTNDITLGGGDYTITLPQNAPLAKASAELPAVPTTTYNGVISGTGTITVRVPAGTSGTLVLTNTSTYSLPTSQLKEYVDVEPCAPFTYDGMVLNGGDCHSHVVVLHGHNAPALFINSGVTVDFDNTHNPAVFAEIRSTVTTTTTLDPASTRYNFDNIEDNGTIVITNANGNPTGAIFGQISGSGMLINHIGGFALAGPSTYSGRSILYSANIDDNTVYGSIPDTSSLFNAFVLSYATPPRTYALTADINSGYPETSPGYVLVPQDIYESAYGNSIHNISYGTLILKGVYRYSDSGDPLNPSLSNPDLDYADCRAGNPSDRRIFIGHAAGITQLGDGTTAQFFLPASAKNGYIWLDRMQGLSFDYNGTVTLDVPINRPDGMGGIFTPGVRPGNVFLLGTPGNHVIFTQPEYYNGYTKIDAHAILQLGDGTTGNENPNFRYTSPKTGRTYQCDYSTSGGNGSLTTAQSSDGDANDRIIDNGTLIVDNVPNALDGVGNISLSNISGSGSLLVEGGTIVTLLPSITYTGTTTIAGGTLALGSNVSLASSSGISITQSGAILDISQAGSQIFNNVSAVSGGLIYLGGNTLTLDSAQAVTFAGTISSGGITGATGGSFVKSGAETLTLTGKVASPTGNCQIQQGTLQLGDANMSQASLQCAVSILASATLSGRGTINGNYTQSAPGSNLAVHINGATAGTQYDQLNISGKIILGGALAVTLGAGTRFQAGEQLTLIKNIGSSPITGTFAGLPEGATLTLNGITFTISYKGGRGHDVVLTVVNGGSASSSGGSGGSIVSSDRGGSRTLLVGVLITIACVLIIVGLLVFFLIYRRRRDISTQPTRPMQRI